MSTFKFPRIAILGAGPVGLTLASLLSKSSSKSSSSSSSRIPFTLFELRPSPINNPTSEVSPLVVSSSLDLHVESGLAALKACGLYEQFCALQTECSEETIVADRDGVRRFHDDGVGGERPEVARNALMGLLLGSLVGKKGEGDGDGGNGGEEGLGRRMMWGCKVLNVSPVKGQGRGYVVRYSNSEGVVAEEEFDVVLGADGAWSRLRGLITDVKPHYSTVNCITLTIPSISTTYPNLSTFIGKGTYNASAAHRSVMAQRGSFDSARVYIMLRDPEQKAQDTYLHDMGLLGLSNAALSAKLLGPGGLLEDWGPELKELVTAGCEASADGEVSVRPLYMLPVDHTWSHRAGLTLLGDAAHLMTPFAGEGVNSGMADALELAELLVPAVMRARNVSADADADAAVREIDAALEAYEKGMFARMEPVARGTWENLEMIFHEEAPGPFVKFFESHGPPPSEEE